jgi:hypothetical protein
MEAASQHGDPIGPRNCHKVLPFEPAPASDRLGWAGLEAASAPAAPSAELDRPAVTHHTLVLFSRPPNESELRYEGVKRHRPPPPGRFRSCRLAARPGGAGAGPRGRCTSTWNRGHFPIVCTCSSEPLPGGLNPLIRRPVRHVVARLQTNGCGDAGVRAATPTHNGGASPRRCQIGRWGAVRLRRYRCARSRATSLTDDNPSTSET